MKIFLCLFTAIALTAGISAAQTPEQLRSYLPELPGWIIDDNIERFGPDNLFDRINGAAPLYIENNFVEMTSMEYKRGDDYITIQLYRHATPEDAFGMYASERTSGLEFFPIGGEAQGDGSSIFFFAGSIYAKIYGNAAGDISGDLLSIADSLADRIDSAAAYPSVFSAFPEQGLIPNTYAYFTANYIGHPFLKGVYTANYEAGGVPYQIFVIDGRTEEGAREVLEKYFAFTKQTDELVEGSRVITDRFNGDIPMLWDGRYIAGIFSDRISDVPDRETILQNLAGRLPGQ